MAKTVVNAERFAKGMTFDEYVRYAGSAENLAREASGGYFPDGGSFGAPQDNSAVLRERYARARLSDHQTAAIKWIVAQPNGPAKVLVIPRTGHRIAVAMCPLSRGCQRRAVWSDVSSIGTARRFSARGTPIPRPPPRPTTTSCSSS